MLKNIKKIWDEKYKNFEYVVKPARIEDIKNWKAMGYTHETFVGKLYDNKNPMPSWVHDLPFDLKNMGFAFYRMDTLNIMPEHIDHFDTYCKIFNIEPKDARRILVFLEDWKPGHYFEMNSIGYTNWKAGDYVEWDYTVPHAASNIGTEPRYTLQITGHV